MSDLETVLDRLAPLGAERLQAVAEGVLRGSALTPLSDIPAYAESPEDALVTLLAPNAPIEARTAVVAACRTVSAEVFGDLLRAGGAEGRAPALGRLCRVAELATPPELRPALRGLLPVVAELRDAAPRTVYEFLSAFSAYEQAEEDIAIWEGLLDAEDFALLAIAAIVRVDPRHPRVAALLSRVWLHALELGWATDVPLLLLRALDLGVDGETVTDILATIHDLRPEAVEELRETVAMAAREGRPWASTLRPALKEQRLRQRTGAESAIGDLPGARRERPSAVAPVEHAGALLLEELLAGHGEIRLVGSRQWEPSEDAYRVVTSAVAGLRGPAGELAQRKFVRRQSPAEIQAALGIPSDRDFARLLRRAAEAVRDFVQDAAAATGASRSTPL